MSYIYQEYPKVVYLNAEKTLWKTAHNAEEEACIMASVIPAGKIDEKENSTPIAADWDATVSVKIEVPQSAEVIARRPGRPPKK
jgi:hypothetical protein